MSEIRFAALQMTLMGGVQPYWAPDDNKIDYTSFLFVTAREAKLNILEDWMLMIEAQIEHPEDWDDDDFPACEGWVQQVELHPDGTITSGDFEWSPQDIYDFFGMEVPK